MNEGRTRPIILVAAVALLNEEGKVLLAKRPPGRPLAGLWEFPGGKVDPGEDPETALIRELMEERRFGEAGTRVVLEECLSGPEVSFFALCDGTRAVPLMSAQDYKRVYDNDEGPNTGGMGAFAPSPLIDAAQRDSIMGEVIEPVMAGMRADGHEYRGFLYAGLMMTCSGPRVIEFNVRFGDPEAQVVIPMIDDELAPHLEAAAAGKFALVPSEPMLSGLRRDYVAMAGMVFGPVPTFDAVMASIRLLESRLRTIR